MVHKKIVVKVSYICGGKTVTETYTFYNCTQGQAYTQCLEIVEKACEGEDIRMSAKIV